MRIVRSALILLLLAGCAAPVKNSDFPHTCSTVENLRQHSMEHWSYNVIDYPCLRQHFDNKTGMEPMPR